VNWKLLAPGFQLEPDSSRLKPLDWKLPASNAYLPRLSENYYA
jgi:hypothetical protein